MKTILAALTLVSGLFCLTIGMPSSAQAGVHVSIGPGGFHIGIHKKRYHKRHYYKSHKRYRIHKRGYRGRYIGYKSRPYRYYRSYRHKHYHDHYHR